MTSNDPTWWNLEALKYHYETQCIPGPLAWFANRLPQELNRYSVGLMFWIELVLPFFVFVPIQLVQYFHAFFQISLQLMIIATGKYNFFNWLTIGLVLSFVDNGPFVRFLSKSNKKLFQSSITKSSLLQILISVVVNLRNF